MAYKDPDYQKKYNQRPEVIERRRTYRKKYWRRPEVKAKAKAYYQHPEVRARVREYRQRPERKVYNKVYNKEYMKKYYQTYNGWKRIISNHGHITDLTGKDFNELKNNPCAYCGEPAFGIDRVDSSKGYLIDNCVACCKKCNRMKLDHTLDKWILHMQEVLKHLGYEVEL